MVRKCRGNSVVAVMDIAQVGVRTRARANLAMAASAAARNLDRVSKRRRIGAIEVNELKFSSNLACNQPKNTTSEQTTAVAPPGNSPSPVAAPVKEGCSSSSNSDDRASLSCCSSNGSSEVEKERNNFVDLEEESDEVNSSAYHCRRREREKTPSSEVGEGDSDDMGSASKQMEEANSRRRSRIMPTQTELEEFFAEVESRGAIEKFSKKYNFDFAKEEPLEGRYEWICLKAPEEERKQATG